MYISKINIIFTPELKTIAIMKIERNLIISDSEKENLFNGFKVIGNSLTIDLSIYTEENKYIGSIETTPDGIFYGVLNGVDTQLNVEDFAIIDENLFVMLSIENITELINLLNNKDKVGIVIFMIVFFNKHINHSLVNHSFNHVVNTLLYYLSVFNMVDVPLFKNCAEHDEVLSVSIPLADALTTIDKAESLIFNNFNPFCEIVTTAVKREIYP